MNDKEVILFGIFGGLLCILLSYVGVLTYLTPRQAPDISSAQLYDRVAMCIEQEGNQYVFEWHGELDFSERCVKAQLIDLGE